jgi:hypothetical protein
VPVQVSYPGVYVNIVATPQPPTGGASTSIAAFIGRAPMGPSEQAVPVLNYADYARKFGGLNKDSAISYQANAFFSNGGEQAVVVRVYKAPLQTSIVVTGTPATGTEYTLAYNTVDGGAATEVPYTAVAGDDTGKVATTLVGLINAQKTAPGTLPAGVTASIDPSDTTGSTILVVIATGTSDDAVGIFAITNNLDVEGPGVIGQGTAQVPIATTMVVTVPDTTAAKKGEYLLGFTPLGGAAINAVYTATADGDATIASNLVTQITQSRTLPNLVSASATANVITLTYKQAVQVSELSPPASPMTLAAGSSLLTFQAASPGLWGDELTVQVDTVDVDTVNLTINYFDGSSYQTERFPNLTFKDQPSVNPNRVDKVLANSSQYLRWTYAAGVVVGAKGTTYVGFGSKGADSAPLDVDAYLGTGAENPGIQALEELPYGFNIVCIPPDDIHDEQGGDQLAGVYSAAADICVQNNAMLIIDPPTSWYGSWSSGNASSISISDLGTFTAEQGRSAAVYFPRVIIADPLMNGFPKVLPNCGFIAAAWASMDSGVGVWKAPAGLDAPIGGIIDLQAKLSDDENGVLNPQGINALRDFNVGGDVVWGARTLRGADVLGDAYKYIPIRRVALYIATSMLSDTKWAVFQPNGQALWARLSDQVGTFMAGLFSQGAFAGTSQDQAFFVKCDATTTLPADQAAGIVNVQIGFAPLYPAEFVVITVSQKQAASSGS